MTAFYLVYSSTRNLFGSNRIAADGIPDHAFNNAMRIIRWERAIGTYHEESIQDWFLPHRTFLQFWNTYYGVAHFVVTLGVFIVLFVRRPQVFPQHRNTLAVTTAVAIVGFAFFPLMPPRLLDEPCPVQAPSGTGRVRRGVHPVRPARRGRIRLRRHPCRVRGPVVVRLRGDGVDLEPVRRDAEPAHRMVGVVRDRGVAVAAAAVEPHRRGCCTRSQRCSASS